MKYTIILILLLSSISLYSNKFKDTVHIEYLLTKPISYELMNINQYDFDIFISSITADTMIFDSINLKYTFINAVQIDTLIIQQTYCGKIETINAFSKELNRRIALKYWTCNSKIGFIEEYIVGNFDFSNSIRYVFAFNNIKAIWIKENNKIKISLYFDKKLNVHSLTYYSSYGFKVFTIKNNKNGSLNNLSLNSDFISFMDFYDHTFWYKRKKVNKVIKTSLIEESESR